MERLLVLRLEVQGCRAAASLNGVPLALAGPANPVIVLPVHEYTLAGDNTLEMTAEPAPPGAAAPEPWLADGRRGASVRLLLPRVGQLAHPANARTLAQIDWMPPDGELVQPPVTLAASVSLPIAFPRWRWLDAPPIDDVPALRADAAVFVQKLALSLARADPEPFVAAARLRFEELALAYQRKLADEVGRWRLQVQALQAAGRFEPRLLSAAALQLRPVAGGRLVECLAPDGSPALAGSGGPGGGRQWQWPLRLASIEGRLHVLR